MKTQIIQLEAHDDTLSVRDKMDWSQTPRVLLIWPESGRLLRKRLDLILLERYCSSHGSQLALVSSDPEVIFQAGKAGIPVFQSRRNAQLQPWGKSFREFQRQDLQRYKTATPPPATLRRDPPPERKKLPLWARIPIFTIGVLSALAIAGTLLPEAEIVLLPEAAQRELSIPFQAEPGRDGIGISGIVPGRVLEIAVNASLSRKTTGSAAVSSQPARGEVTFTNLTGESILIPEGTILSTTGPEPVLFLTLAESQTPPGPGEQITVGIEALYPGVSGNVPQGSIQKINLEAGAELAVSNAEPTSGGADLDLPAPSQADRAILSRQLDQVLEEKAFQEISAALDPGDILLTNDLGQPQIVEESYQPPGSEPGDTLWLDRTTQYQVFYADGEDMLALSRELVRAQYQDDLRSPDWESIKLEDLEPPSIAEDGNFHWQERIKWQDVAVILPEQILPLVLGKSPEQAAADLQEELELSQTPEIILHPGWWPRLPALPFRITIVQGDVTDVQ